MEERGVLLLLEAARRSSWLQIHLLCRPWSSGYTNLEATRRIIKEQSLQNVGLSNEVVTDMPRVYAGSDFTIVPFTTRDAGKENPNRAVESFACGVPLLVTKTCPFACLVEENACVVTFHPNPQGLAEAVLLGIAVWPELSTAARRAAESQFDTRKLLSYYGRVYREASGGAQQHAIRA